MSVTPVPENLKLYGAPLDIAYTDNKHTKDKISSKKLSVRTVSACLQNLCSLVVKEENLLVANEK